MGDRAAACPQVDSEFELEQSERGLAVPYDADASCDLRFLPGHRRLECSPELRHRLGDNAGIGHQMVFGLAIPLATSSR